MRAFRPLIVVATAAMGCACTTLPIDPATTRVVPPERIFVASAAGKASAPGDGTITVLRDWGYGGGGCNFNVYLDATRVAEIHLAEKLELHAPSGHHFIRIDTATFLCAQQLLSQDVTVEAGQEQQFRIQMSWNGNALARIK